MPGDQIPVFESGGRFYINLIRPHDDSLRQKMYVERLLDERQMWLERYPSWAAANGVPEDVMQHDIASIKERISFWKSVLDGGNWDNWR